MAARTRAWRTLERNGHLFVWNDPEGNPPPDDVTIPVIEGASSDGWTDWTWDTIPVNGIHCREVVDNMVDMAHFYYIHKGLPTYFKNVFEGHLCTQYYAGTTPEHAATGAPIDIGKFEGQTTQSEATYYGPSFMINWIKNDYKGFVTDVVLINCHIPTGPNSFVLQYGLKVLKVF